MTTKTLRYRAKSGWVTKNDKLAAVEVDDNFIAIEEDLANNTDPALGAGLVGVAQVSTTENAEEVLSGTLRTVIIGALNRIKYLYTYALARLVSWKGGAISVLDYGAVADGDFQTGAGTDNSAAFASAIAALSTLGGGALRVPAGIYKLTTGFTVPSGISILGDGPWSTILFAPTSFSNSSGLIRISGSGGYPTLFSGIGVLGQEGGAGGWGIVSTKNGVFIKDVWVAAWVSGGGIKLSQTDNFLSNFALELSNTGVEVTASNVQVENGTVYACTQGALVTNAADTEPGAVTFSNVRASSCSQSGFVVAGGKNVQIGNCSASSDTNSHFTVAGVLLDSASDTIITGFKATLGDTSTTGYGVKTIDSTRIQISAGSCRGWLDGVYISGGKAISVTSLTSTQNGRRGVSLLGGDQIKVSDVNASNNGGGGSTDAGIYSDNTSGYAVHQITNCMTTQDGGGAQEYGIYSNIADNGGASGFTGIVGNIAKFNTTANISKNGVTANITDSGNMT